MATKKNTSDELEEKTNEVAEEKTRKKSDKDYEAENIALKEQLAAMSKRQDDLTAMITALLNASANNNTNNNNKENSLTKEVKIVHLYDRAPGLSTHIELTSLTMDLHAFGEERTLDMRQAEELAGKYRHLFESGIIAFGSECDDVANRFALKAVGDYRNIDKAFLEKLVTISCYELEKLYESLCNGHRALIIEYFKRKIIENKDARFKDSAKIDMLNRVSNGAMNSVLLEKQREAAIKSAQE